MPRLGRLEEFDRRVVERANGACSAGWVRGLFRAASRLGDGVLWYALMIVLLLTHGAAALGPVLHMGATALAGTLLYKWLKARTSRPRPYRVHARIHAALPPLDEFSFPSGHTLHAVSFTLVASAYYPLLALPLALFTLLVAASRLVLGLHYPSDVLAGALLGAGIALVSFALV
jgi:undecaprenyl-diphosphatase